jgi:hypothetical protein
MNKEELLKQLEEVDREFAAISAKRGSIIDAILKCNTGTWKDIAKYNRVTAFRLVKAERGCSLIDAAKIVDKYLEETSQS